jgi:hypothetical protein
MGRAKCIKLSFFGAGERAEAFGSEENLRLSGGADFECGHIAGVGRIIAQTGKAPAPARLPVR